MKKYIGTKLIEAEKAVRVNGEVQPLDGPVPEGSKVEHGYKVRYADGYESFSPKNVFEKACMPLTINEALRTDAPSISQQMVDDFIVDITADTMGSKTTVVKAKLANGFEIVESSSCVSAENYDEELGAEICIDKIKDKVWYLLGFLLQTAVNGVDIPRTVEPERDLEQEYADQVEQEESGCCCEECSDAEEVCKSDNAEPCDCGNGACGGDEDAGGENIDVCCTEDAPAGPVTLKRTMGLMMSPSFKDRVKAEYHQLAIRCEKLEAMCQKYEAGELDFTPNCPLELLKKQLRYMQGYKDILELRADIEGIDLQDTTLDGEEILWAFVAVDQEKCSVEGNCGSLITIIFDGLTKAGEGEELPGCEGCPKD